MRGPLRGRRVVVTTDGGRLRERLPAPAGRKNKRTGHRRYKAPWREPKLLVIYVIDDEGKVLQSFRPVYDGTLGDADQVFEMLVGYRARSTKRHPSNTLEPHPKLDLVCL